MMMILSRAAGEWRNSSERVIAIIHEQNTYYALKFAIGLHKLALFAHLTCNIPDKAPDPLLPYEGVARTLQATQTGSNPQDSNLASPPNTFLPPSWSRLRTGDIAPCASSSASSGGPCCNRRPVCKRNISNRPVFDTLHSYFRPLRRCR
jgi:hypothetical protein